jgi:hypothetical protein
MSNELDSAFVEYPDSNVGAWANRPKNPKGCVS